jgi:hypothetical protein
MSGLRRASLRVVEMVEMVVGMRGWGDEGMRGWGMRDEGDSRCGIGLDTWWEPDPIEHGFIKQEKRKKKKKSMMLHIRTV